MRNAERKKTNARKEKMTDARPERTVVYLGRNDKKRGYLTAAAATHAELAS